MSDQTFELALGMTAGMLGQARRLVDAGRLHAPGHGHNAGGWSVFEYLREAAEWGMVAASLKAKGVGS